MIILSWLSLWWLHYFPQFGNWNLFDVEIAENELLFNVADQHHYQ